MTDLQKLQLSIGKVKKLMVDGYSIEEASEKLGMTEPEMVEIKRIIDKAEENK